MNQDEMIRAALERVAERAPDPLAVQLALTSRARRYRQRRLMLATAGAAAVAVAASGGAAQVLLRGRKQPTDPDGAPATQPPTGSRIPLPFSPSWLPDGFIETSRTGSGQGSNREWTRRNVGADTDDDDPRVWLQVGPRSQFDLRLMRQATVRGGVGWVPDPTKSIVDDGQVVTGASVSPTVIWQAGSDLLVQAGVDQVPEGQSAATRVVEGLVADPAGILAVPMAFGWLPTGFGSDPSLHLSGTRRSWLARISENTGQRDGAGHSIGSTVAVTLGTDAGILAVDRHATKVNGATALTVRGRPGKLLFREYPGKRPADPGSVIGMVECTLADGLHLHVTVSSRPPSPTWTRTDLLRLVEELLIGPVPDLSWLGA